VKKRQRCSCEEETEALLWRRGRGALVEKRQRWSCEEEEEGGKLSSYLPEAFLLHTFYSLLL
jgi:hypothetical protein